MLQLNLLLIMAVVLTACGRPGTPIVVTPIDHPALVLPPTWTPTPIGPTAVPSITPTPTIARTSVPPATPSASSVFTSTDGLISLKIPSNWFKQSGQRQLLATTSQQLAYLQLGVPGAPPQPAIIIFYNWQAVTAIDNDNAWQQAYALASLAIKGCGMIFTNEVVSVPIAIGGELGQVVSYTDACGEQGELVGLVHHGVNVGIIIETPQPLWKVWQPILRGIIGSLVIK